MSRLSRKPLESYATMPGGDHSPAENGAGGMRLRSHDKTSPDQRSSSPTKRGLYPNVEKEAREATYNKLYPALTPDLHNLSTKSAMEDELDFSDSINENTTLPHADSPVPPPRTRRTPKDISGSPFAEHESRRPVELKPRGFMDEYWWIIPSLVVLASSIFLAWNYGYLDRFIGPSTDPNKIALREFEERFKNFTRDYKDELHKESLETLHSALEHHVEMSQNKNQRYPTCVLLAGDEKSAEMQNYLAGEIARLIPKKATGSLHQVDLSDTSVDHKKADQEDLRSRVHNGVNKSLKEGADIMVFRNLDALAPADIPLLNLFYSYCDGENPTFPKTLWILTMATKGLEIFDSPKRADFKEFHRNAGKAVERYLGHFLESTPQQPTEDPHTAVNPLLTRIANYIIPVIPTGRPIPETKKSKL